ncbi:ExeA family protein [Ideonella oryzae]|uniref:AAA family ATPase n=1 Tax=Ideonella oryzae TaxID=2937441 RepID=A0ABT1BT27_9BURK|nr:ExeA family protein [Ideonella oryzae]MCO5979351.1 AAA family ATPase [Ideonella oryzae]
MYESFFGLACEPFSVAPDPRFLYLSKQHRDALGYLNYGLRRAGGFVLLTGEIGAGKTTVWRAFLEQLPPRLDVAYVVNPKMSVQALLKRLCESLQVELPADADRPGAEADLIDALHGHLLLAHAQGRRTLVVVDEAQALALPVLEQLRLLTNLVTNEDKLVQVLLIGQPELRQLLEHPEMAPVAQRIVARFHLQTLSRDETEAYLSHRLTVAGLTGPVPFDDEAIRRIHRLCRGTPRRINVLCDRAMTLAAERGQHRVDRALVDLAAGQVFDLPGLRGTVPLHAARWLAGGAAAALTVFALTRVLPPWQQATAAPGAASAVVAGVAPAPASSPSSAAALARTAASPPSVAAPVPTPVAPPTATALSHGLQPYSPLGPATDDLSQIFAQPLSEAEAWQRLAQRWKLTLLPTPDPCSNLPSQGLRCHSSQGGLGPVRLLDRPGWLLLTDPTGRSARVLLEGLQGDQARLGLANGHTLTVPLLKIAPWWQGEFHTLWRSPPGYGGDGVLAAEGPSGLWLAEHLARLDGGPAQDKAEGLALRIRAFQMAQGLRPDGLPGPLTLMRLNHATGLVEPTLGEGAAR